MDVLKWKLQNQAVRWPALVPAPRPARPELRVSGFRFTHVGHGSYLLQVAGRNILVDPVWSERVSPFSRFGPRRHNPPGIAFPDLPPVDLVLITHNHYDHLDTATLRRLAKTHHPRVFTPLGNDVIINKAVPDLDVQAGDWWDAFSVAADFRITIVPADHWSQRGSGDRRHALWGGLVLETSAGVIYCAGDTAYRGTGLFREIGTRFGPPDVAALPIGAYAPRWFMQTQHVNPAEAIQIAQDCGAKQVLGIHWGTFALTDEAHGEPAEFLAQEVKRQSLDPARFLAMQPGETWTMPGRPGSI